MTFGFVGFVYEFLIISCLNLLRVSAFWSSLPAAEVSLEAGRRAVEYLDTLRHQREAGWVGEGSLEAEQILLRFPGVVFFFLFLKLALPKKKLFGSFWG